ncbi:MAG: hypothetical protein HXX18_11890 [Bacteroidetes bacterium]|nr:hypothetical protein [Bacteroidota bacterium]
MIDSIGITTTIDELDVLYNSNPLQATYFSKLAVLELCGWLELTMDCIVNECANSKLSLQSNKDFFEKKVVDSTFGFHYDQHFRPMLMKLIGLIKLEQIESGLITSGELSILESHLGTLNQTRRRAAHTSIVGATVTYEAPSKIRQYLNTLFPILKKFETALQII